MDKRQRRHSQNSNLMRQIIALIREYDLDEVKLLCNRYMDEQNKRKKRKSIRRYRKSSRTFIKDEE